MTTILVAPQAIGLGNCRFFFMQFLHKTTERPDYKRKMKWMDAKPGLLTHQESFLPQLS